MTELSPKTQAVLDAAYRCMDDNPFNEVNATLAAALRAAADQVVPELSPAAQAVLDASSDAPVGGGWNADRLAIAAALRAAADQVVPSDALYARSCCEFVGERCRADLLAIAAELEAHGEA